MTCATSLLYVVVVLVMNVCNKTALAWFYPPLLVLASQLALTILVLLPFSQWGSHARRWLACVAPLFTAALVGGTFAVQCTTVSSYTMIRGLVPLCVYVFEVHERRERLSPAALASAGCVVIAAIAYVRHDPQHTARGTLVSLVGVAVAVADRVVQSTLLREMIDVPSCALAFLNNVAALCGVVLLLWADASMLPPPSSWHAHPIEAWLALACSCACNACMCTVGIELQRCTSATASAIVQAMARALTIGAGVVVFRDAAVGPSLGAIVLYVTAYIAFAARERLDAWCADRSPADEALLLGA